jgi:hypothetical protein
MLKGIDKGSQNIINIVTPTINGVMLGPSDTMDERSAK